LNHAAAAASSKSMGPDPNNISKTQAIEPINEGSLNLAWRCIKRFNSINNLAVLFLKDELMM
jgi:hypothetical protein